ncbi:MAG: CBS domain-containing protein [Bryobacterales bacterium]|jgi:predicted transcriptional regulator|nr:CBS domain-containing protein [Bryobacterales bacterium]
MNEQPNEQPILVRDLMTVGVVTCSTDDALADIARLMLAKELEAVVVLNPHGHAVGVVTQDDVLRVYDRENARSLTAEAVMREEVPTVPPDIPARAAAQIMQDRGVRILFSMHHAEGIFYPAATLTYRHLLRHLSTAGPEDLNDLGIHADREPPLTAFVKRRDAAREQNVPKKQS